MSITCRVLPALGRDVGLLDSLDKGYEVTEWFSRTLDLFQRHGGVAAEAETEEFDVSRAKPALVGRREGDGFEVEIIPLLRCKLVTMVITEEVWREAGQLQQLRAKPQLDEGERDVGIVQCGKCLLQQFEVCWFGLVFSRFMHLLDQFVAQLDAFDVGNNVAVVAVEPRRDQCADLAPAPYKRDIADTEEFDTAGQFRFDTAHTLGHQAQFPIIRCQQSQDAVGLPVLGSSQYNAARQELVHCGCRATSLTERSRLASDVSGL